MRLKYIDGMAVDETFEVLVKMTVIIIAIDPEMKTRRLACQVFDRLAYPHDLQGLFAGDAGGGLEITLQCPGTDPILPGEFFYRNVEVIFPRR